MSKFVFGLLPEELQASVLSSVDIGSGPATRSLIHLKSSIPFLGGGMLIRFTNLIHDSGCLLGYDHDYPFDEEKVRARLGKKGWSQAKIARNIELEKDKQDKQFIKRNPWKQSRHERFLAWQSMMTKLRDFQIDHISLFWHSVTGLIDDTSVKITEERNITLGSLKSDSLSSLPADILLRVKLN